MSLMSVVFAWHNPYYSCQPFICVAMYADYFFTMGVPVWVIIETHMTKSSHKLTSNAIIEANELKAR